MACAKANDVKNEVSSLCSCFCFFVSGGGGAEVWFSGRGGGTGFLYCVDNVVNCLGDFTFSRFSGFLASKLDITHKFLPWNWWNSAFFDVIWCVWTHARRASYYRVLASGKTFLSARTGTVENGQGTGPHFAFLSWTLVLPFQRSLLVLCLEKQIYRIERKQCNLTKRTTNEVSWFNFCFVFVLFFVFWTTLLYCVLEAPWKLRILVLSRRFHVKLRQLSYFIVTDFMNVLVFWCWIVLFDLRTSANTPIYTDINKRILFLAKRRSIKAFMPLGKLRVFSCSLWVTCHL